MALALAPWCGAPDWTELAHPDRFLQLRASPAYGKKFPCRPSQRPRDCAFASYNLSHSHEESGVASGGCHCFRPHSRGCWVAAVGRPPLGVVALRHVGSSCGCRRRCTSGRRRCSLCAGLQRSSTWPSPEFAGSFPRATRQPTSIINGPDAARSAIEHTRGHRRERASLLHRKEFTLSDKTLQLGTWHHATWVISSATQTRNAARPLTTRTPRSIPTIAGPPASTTSQSMRVARIRQEQRLTHKSRSP